MQKQPGQPFIRIVDLQKKFAELTAVAGISLEVQHGENFGLLGPNGAGKTTTLNMIVGLLQPDGGYIEIDGAREITSAEVKKRIGTAPQSLSLYDDMSAVENLSFFGRLYGLAGKKLAERIDWTLSFSGLQDRQADRVKTFSGGMKRRLNLACALVHDPTLLLLDEPTVGVDPQSRNHIFDSIEKLNSQGTTVIYTTHYMEEAQRLCDRVAIIDKGKILAIDSVDKLIEQHGGVSVIKANLASRPADPSVLPGELNGSALRIETDRPLEVIAQLTDRGIKFSTLSVDQADLETVFLNLTGRRLRDK
ncbi:MAG: ABC transporter ATP-binding protein [Deltaproteobacteria bacterium]|nr:ABC transporter ATP-binding protein [Deltaproteobacteria bacterium]